MNAFIALLKALLQSTRMRPLPRDTTPAHFLSAAAAASKPRVITQQDDRASANAVNRRAGGWREYLDCAVRFVESHAVGAEMTLKDNLVDRRAKTNSGAVEVLVDRIRQRDGNGIFGPDGVGKVAATRRQAH
jgi:hypothetical protein